MKFIILNIFFNLLSSGHLQEANNADYNLIHPDVDKYPRSNWPPQSFQTIQGNFYDQAQRNILPKPCSRRSNSESETITQQLNPPLTSKVETLNDVAVTLKSGALRYGEYDSKTTDNQVLQTTPLTIEDDNLYKTRNSLSVSNPVIDSFEENHREVIPTVNNEIQEDNLKPSNQLHSTTHSDSPSLSTSVVISSASRNYQSKPAGVFRFEPSNEYGAEPENNYISVPNNVLIAAENNEFRSTQINEASTARTDYFPEFISDFHHIQTHTLRPGLVSKLHSKPNEAVSALPNKCSHEKEPNLIGHLRRSMSSDNDEDDANDILSNGKEMPRNNNDPYIESRIGNENAMASVLNVEKKTPKSSKDQGLRSLDKSNLPTHEKSVSRVGRPQFNEARREMIEPTKGAGVVNMGQSSLMLMQTERICYACSTANNPSCWAPDRRTTVKYCRKGNNACITKTFGKGSTFTLIRDCGRSCDDSDIGGLMPKYKSCSMCHSELCNGAYSINGHSIIFTLILIAIIKYLK